MNAAKPYILVVVVALLIGAIYFINSNSVKRGGETEDSVAITPRTSSGQNEMTKANKMKRYELAKEVTTPDGFINTNGKPVTIGEFVGKKVVLIDFWTYSCINCQRTTPYLNSWYEKYKDKGLVIIGIHTPEFEFEKDYDNVKTAVEKFGIKFPVVLDNDYSTWTAYRNQYWPRKYLIDIDGYIVYDHIGEGAYEETEKRIQDALIERMAVLGEAGEIDQSLTKETPNQNGAKSPETYFGSAREPREKNFLLPVDGWNITPEFAQNTLPNTSIVYQYTAKDVFFVAEADTETIVEVLRNGKPLGAEAGLDIIKTSDGKTIVKIKEARLYKIINGNQTETDTLELKIKKPGLKAFTFTFG
jgi:thiol-disulfide isomerase/thioredoxin